jgi:hypothetical protein
MTHGEPNRQLKKYFERVTLSEWRLSPRVEGPLPDGNP